MRQIDFFLWNLCLTWLIKVDVYSVHCGCFMFICTAHMLAALWVLILHSQCCLSREECWLTSVCVVHSYIIPKMRRVKLLKASTGCYVEGFPFSDTAEEVVDISK